MAVLDEPGDLAGELLGAVLELTDAGLLPEPELKGALLGAYLDRHHQVGGGDAPARRDQGRLDSQQPHPELQAKREDPLPKEYTGGRV